MLKLLMLRGLPASGKSTYAKELVAKSEKWKRVNKDELREMIDGGQWSKKNEKCIQNTRDALIAGWLAVGYNVVVDDTNFHGEHEVKCRQLALEHGADFEVKFFDTPFMECIERDLKRGDKSVGKKVITEMYVRYLKPQHYNIDTNLPDTFIFDIDGTLAKLNGRSPYDYTKVGTDLPNPYVTEVFRFMQSFKGSRSNLIVVSGRDSVCREDTLTWLHEHGLFPDKLLMRAEGDSRKDSEIKMELFDKHIRGKYNVLGVFDDRNQVVDMWRSLGLTCFQVDYGFF